MLLWLLQRPYLRYLPVPYPSVSNLEQWKLQCGRMVSDRSWCSVWIRKARAAGQFTVSNLSELSGFRNRQGLHWTFLEDPLLQGMLAARQTKGAVNALKKAAVEEAQRQAASAEQEGKRMEALRTLIGPKGGLPSLKADLFRLAALLHIKVDASMKVDDLKSLCKPIVNDLKFDAPKPKASSGSSSSRSAAIPQANSWKPDPPPDARHAYMQEIQTLLTNQDQKVQTMMNQVMQHVMSMQPTHHPQQFQMFEPTEAEINQIMADHAHDPDEGNMDAMFGDDLLAMSPEELAEAQEQVRSWR